MSDGTWTQWAKYVIETLRDLTTSMKELEIKCGEFIDRGDHNIKCAALQRSVSEMRNSLDTAINDITAMKEQIKAHSEKHDYKWKLAALISTILAIILSALTIINKIK